MVAVVIFQLYANIAFHNRALFKVWVACSTRVRGSHSLANCAGLKIQSLVVRGFESLPPHHHKFVISAFSLQRNTIAKIIAKTCQFLLTASAHVVFSLVIIGEMCVNNPTNKVEMQTSTMKKLIPGV